MKLSTDQVDRLRQMLSTPGLRAAIVSHTNPDGDAVGSSLAWAGALRALGHEATCVCMYVISLLKIYKFS